MKKTILVIKHVENEGPGSMGDFFRHTALPLHILELSRQEKLPDDLRNIAAVVSLGGPMNVYAEEKYPFLKAEDDFIKKVIGKGVPFLGICLGAQLLAKACGAKIIKAPREEIGWFKVYSTEAAKTDSLFKGLGEELDVFQWHEDTFELPLKAQLLVTSPNCKYQAFRIGPNAYGVQFHIEVTEEMIKEWIGEYTEHSDARVRIKRERMLVEYPKIRKNFLAQAEKIYRNFSAIIGPG
jgi:GMP synthase (glutamine-hydrolysing)